MTDLVPQPIAVVGVSAIMPDAPDAATFWANIRNGRYSISDVPPGRWDPELYYDPDAKAPDKTYSRVGGWVRDYPWDPMAWRLPVPPTVAAQMEVGQRWSVSAARAALLDAGWPSWQVDPERVAVILGNAIGGDKHYQTSLRVDFPEFARELRASPSFAALAAPVRDAVLAETRASFLSGLPPITEDTMPGELANILAGRVANLLNLRGPNYTTDAACASGLAAMSTAIRGLQAGDYDAVVSGGLDRNMNAAAFVKFCKIGALSATGSRPFDAGADGFVMGEGAALFVLRRLADAERDGDRVYAVLLSLAGASDGRGKGITAPNPVGQRLAVERAWASAGVDPALASCVEAHGTSTRVGDAVELASLTEVFGKAGARPGSIALGSVKSNIGHLKGAAGAAGLFKTVLSLHDKVLAPSLNFAEPNPNVDWETVPFKVNTALREWPEPPCGVRLAGVSAFGFGGTNFHVVVEEYVPGRHRPPQAARAFAGVDVPAGDTDARPVTSALTSVAARPPLRGAAVVGGQDDGDLLAQLESLAAGGAAGPVASTAPDPTLSDAAVRVAIDYADAADLAVKAARAVRALRADIQRPADANGSRQPGRPGAAWRALRAQGIFLGRGRPGKVAFLYTGQGSQYMNMLRTLTMREPVVRDTFAEADEIMTPLLGKPLTSYIFADNPDTAALARLERQLLQTEITQPAVLAADLALTRLLECYGVRPDMVMGHSLGEYGALVAAGALSFRAALEAVSARGREMTNVSMADNGAMAAVFGPLAEVERIVEASPGYVVVANINSTGQAVVGGATDAVEQIITEFRAAGMTANRIPVSHAFHTAIVAPASEPLKVALRRLDVRPPILPIVSNVTGRFYPADASLETMLELLGRQVAEPVRFVDGLHTLYDAGARVFVEVGPKKALHGFVDDVLGTVHDDVLALFTNHPKFGDIPAFNQALCGLYAAGLAFSPPASVPPTPTTAAPEDTGAAVHDDFEGTGMTPDRYAELGRLFAGALEQGMRIYTGTGVAPSAAPLGSNANRQPPSTTPVVVTGAALGLPGVPRVFDDENLARILNGQQFIDTIPHRLRQAMVDRKITRLVKPEHGDPTFAAIDNEADVVKLAGRGAHLDLVTEYGVDPERDAALDIVTRLAIGAGFDALRDAGLPLVMHYKTTTLGTRLPDRWGLPEAMRDDTGVIFASAFPAYDAFAQDLERYFTDRGRREQLAALEAVRARMRGDDPAVAEIERRLRELRHQIASDPYVFDRRFLFRCLSMGHSQFAEIIGARGPNTQVNAACASTTQAICLAEDWIRVGRCRRVVVVSADDATSDTLLPWMASGFLATGAAATDDIVADAATPFDRRRHGMIVGMGAAALVVEAAEAARERGLQPICEVLGAVTANSAYHGTRLDTEHIGAVMEQVVRQAESRGADRYAMVPAMVFVSHETYTPARGGSASAEINALRRTFGSGADTVVITNTKGFTGHAMGAGIEDVVAVKSLETGLVPAVPNYKEPDPELGQLNLSAGGAYPVRYAMRLAAGFGSQIAMTLLRWTPMPDGRHRAPSELGYEYRIVDPAAWQRWLTAMSGQPDPRLEVERRRLRTVDVRPTTTPPVTAPPVTAPPVTAPPVVTPPAIAPVTVAPVVAPPAMAPVTVAPVMAPIAAPPVPVPQPSAARQGTPAPQSAAPRETTVESGPATDSVTDAVVGIVSDLTGYPPDLLELDLDLEADLGVDTVKQAEVFAAVRERFDVPRDDDLRLRDFPTLTHVIGWITSQTGTDQAGTGQAAASGAGVGEPAANGQATPAAAESATAEGSTRDEITDAVVGIVSDLTGYPPDLLELDLDLEADLGVDTVKQAEVFAAVRERFDVPRDDDLRLRDFPTLTHVIGWITDRMPGTPEEPAADGIAGATMGSDAMGSDADSAADIANAISGDITATDRLPRRVPVPTLRPPLSACVPTGIALDHGDRVVVMRDQGGVGDALVARLERLGVQVLAPEPGIATDTLDDQIMAYADTGPVHGVFWLPALDDEGPLTDLDLPAWREALRRRVGCLYTAMRRLYQQRPFLIVGTRLGGYHGYDPAGATCPLGGAVTGFAKAYQREQNGVVVKAVDFAVSRKTAALADVLVDEALRDPGCVEVGYAMGRRWGVGLAHRPFPDLAADDDSDDQRNVLTPETVFLVTGAAGSIVSAITADLAGAAHGTFHLLDLTPTPDPADADLHRYATDRDGFKAELATRMRDRGERPTPVAIERELARYERLRAAMSAVRAVTDAGGTAHYHQVDLTDPDAVRAVLAEVRATSGRVDVLLHGAGVEISHALPDKEPGEFDLVFGVKADGLFNILHSAGDLPIGTVVAFSSVAGRFGNVGQTDYSAANDLLCKLMSGLRRSGTSDRPAPAGLAIDWTAWGGIGMATRGSIPKLMELAGVELLPPEIGIAWIRRELLSRDTSAASGIPTETGIPTDQDAAGQDTADRSLATEVVVAGALGRMATEPHPTGGVAPTALPVDGAGPMVGEVVAVSVTDGLIVRTTLDPASQPFLDDHRIEGTAVLPGVMGIEAFAETARLMAPDWVVESVEDVDFLVPVKFYRDEPRTLTITALLRPDGPDLLAECRLTAERMLPGSDSPQITVHFTGSVRLVRHRHTEECVNATVDEEEPALLPDDVYRLYFHGPAYQVVGAAWRHNGGTAARLAGDLPPAYRAEAGDTVVGPRLVELCFQTAGLCEAGDAGRLALPRHVDRLRLLVEPTENQQQDGPLVAVARPDEDGFHCAVVDGHGAEVLRMDGYRTVPLRAQLPGAVRDAINAVLHN